MIVKIQISLATSADKSRVLVYNEDRSIRWEDKAPEAVLILMNGAPKRFFHADVDKDGRLILDSEAPEQEW